MKKVAICFWSGTGNTEAMAEAVENGVKSAGGEAVVIAPDDFNAEDVEKYDAIAFGCPSMGEEVLEESEFQPMWDRVSSALSGKNIALFGSYGWGDGEWMRNWDEECQGLGANQVVEFVICNEEPDDEAVEACEALGKALAE